MKRTVPESELKGIARTNLDSPKPTTAQLARRARSLAVLDGLGLISNKSLPVVEDENSFSQRSADEIAKRCLAILVCAAKGETHDSDFVNQLIRDFDIRGSFTPLEKEFIAKAHPTQQELINFSWQYEAAHVLLWALGHEKELAPPNRQADVGAMVATVREYGATGILARARLRSKAELLDMADLYYHLHWSAIELRLRGETSDAVDEGTVRERHRALNWLIRYLGEEWDDVTTDT